MQKYATHKWDGLEKEPLRMHKLYHPVSFKILIPKCESKKPRAEDSPACKPRALGERGIKRQTVVGSAKAVERNQKMDMHGRYCGRSSAFPEAREGDGKLVGTGTLRPIFSPSSVT